MREINIDFNGIDVNDIEQFKQKVINTHSSQGRSGVKGDVEFETECPDHKDAKLLYDTENRYYYCPLCEK